MKKVLVAMGTVLVAVLFCKAMPTDAEIRQTEPGVVTIVGDIAKRANGNCGQTAIEILNLEKDAGNEVERYLLRREAVLNFVRDGNVAKARETLTRFTDESDEASVVAINEYVMRKLTIKERRAFKGSAEYKEFDAFVRGVSAELKERNASERRLKELEAAWKKNPKDTGVRNRLAMEYACNGDWSKAIPLLAEASGEIGKAAQGERAKPDAAGLDAVAIADAWWNVEGRADAPKLTKACRQHAAEWYRKVIADESLSRLVRARIGGRIDEVENSIEMGTGHAKGLDGSDIKGFPRVSVKGGERVKCLLNAKERTFMELTTCAPGEFEMGEGNEAHNRSHKVRLSYPYLITCGHVTYGMVKAVHRKGWKELFDNLKPNESKFYDDDRAVGGLTTDDLDQFLEKLNAQAARCPELKPYRGYEFRLPTEAEWFRAYLAGGNVDMEDITDAELKAYWGKLGNAEWKWLPPEGAIRKMSEKKSNAWGVFNMVRGKEEIVDTIPLPKDKKGMRAFWLPDSVTDCFKYADLEENPYRLCKDRNACHIVRKGRSRKEARPLLKTDERGNVTGGPSGCCLFRLVYGPKLDKLNVYPKKGDEKRK